MNRPVFTPAQNRDLILTQARVFKETMPADHPAQARMDDVIRRHTPPPFPVHKTPAEARSAANDSAMAYATLVAGCALLVLGGDLMHRSLPWSITALLIGALTLNWAFSQAERAQ
jgi:hypothetical protein